MDHTLEVQQFSGPVVRVLPGQAAFARENVLYRNDEWLWVETPNNQTSQIVVRMDRKQQQARIEAVPVTGWRAWLGRIVNRFTRRYKDIPLASVECNDWQVTAVQDLREIAR